jgi:hypothetical protein
MVRREDELPFSGEIDSHPFATHAANQSRPSNKDITSVSRCLRGPPAKDRAYRAFGASPFPRIACGAITAVSGHPVAPHWGETGGTPEVMK